MVDFRNWKILGRFGGRRKQESERLDAFLKDLADPGLIESLKEEDNRRSSVWLAVAALILGLLLGSGATAWWFSRSPALSSQVSSSSSEELAHTLAAQGLAFTKAKEIDQAWSHLRLAIEMQPNLFDAWAAMGLAQLYGGQAGEAERSFLRCTQIDPGDPRGFQGLGDVYFATGDYKRAEEYWLKGNANRSVSRLRLLEGRFNEAAPLIRELVRQTPDQLYVQTMSEALRAGHLTPELRWRLGPGIAGSRSSETARGWRLYFSGRYEEAAGVFGQVLAGSRGDASARIGRGWCRLRARGYQQAREDFESALATWPSNYSALNGLGWSLKGLGRPAEAAVAWQRVLELNAENPEAPESLKGLGMLAYERGDFPEADHALTRSLLQNPYDQETRAILNETLKRMPADEM